MNKERQNNVFTFPLLNDENTILTPVTYRTTKEINMPKKRTTTIRPGNPNVGEEFSASDVQYFGKKEVKFRCIKGRGSVFIRKLERDNQGKIIPNKSIGFFLEYVEEGLESTITLLPDHFCIFQNTGNKTLVFEDNSLDSIPEDLPNGKPFVWIDDLEYMNARNIGLPAHAKVKNGDPSVVNGLSYGKIVEEGKLFSRN